MAQAIKLRVLIDYEAADVFRDLVIRTDHSFLDLHNSIVSAFDFDQQELASFYLSNDTWDRGREITRMPMTTSEVADMAGTQLSEVITEPGQKLLYVYDFLRMWCFFLEIISIGPVSNEQNYPSVVLTHGDAPDPLAKSIASASIAVDTAEDFWTEPREDGSTTTIDNLFDDLDLNDPTRFN